MKLLLASFFILVTFFGCSDSAQDNGDNQAKIADPDLEMVSFLTGTVIQPRLTRFVDTTTSMYQSLSNTCGTDAEVSVSELKDLWTLMMMDFHYTEVFLYGPLLIADETKIGDTNPIKKVIYSLQNSSTQMGLIDKEIVNAGKKGEKYKARKKQNIIGLDALEYVLFSSLSERESLSGRSGECFYLRFVAQSLFERVTSLEQQYQDKVMVPLTQPEGLTRVRIYLDHLLKGMVAFADKELKDRKIAIPLGIEVNSNEKFPCVLGEDCQNYLEHPFALMADSAVNESLQAISDAFSGKNKQKKIGFGFSDYLTLLKGADKTGALPGLASDLKAFWTIMPQGQDYVDAFASYLGDDDLQNPAFEAYSRLRELTSWLKTGFIVDMNTELPGNVQGDND